MKYTKKVPYFKKGKTVKKRVEVGNTGKTREEIMAEARPHQTREKGQQAMDREAKLAAENRKTAADNANVSKPKTDLSTKTIAKQPLAKTFGRSLTEIQRAPVKQSLDKLSFGEAFNRSHKEGLKVFEWRGEKYTTDQKKAETPVSEEGAERRTNEAKTSKDKTSKGKTSTKVEQSTSPWITRPVTDRYGNIIQGPVPRQITNRQQHSIDVSRLPGDSEAEWVNSGWSHINEAGEKEPLEAKRFIWPSGADYTYLANNDDTRFFQRDIYEGDTTYLDHTHNTPAASLLPSYKQIFADVDKKIWEARGHQPGGINDGFQQQPNESVSADNVVTNTINTSPQVTVDGNITTYREDNPYTGPRYYRREFNTNNEGVQVPTYFSGTSLDNLKKVRDYALVNKGPYYRTQKIFDKVDQGQFKKRGGTIDKLQRGNVLTNREQHLVDVSRLPKLSVPQVWGRKLFGTGPKPVETGRTHLNKAGEQVPEVGNRVIMPGGRDNTTITRGTNYGSGWLTSQRNIQRGDTTYVTPGGNAPSAADLPRYKSVFDNADRAIWKSRGYQQGGAIQQQGVDKEALVADFVVRYLKTMGVPEEAIVTPEGSINPEYEQELTTVITEIDSPEFWEAYQNSPDEVVTQVVRARNPNAVAMARKGAKLKRLSQLRIYKK